MIPRIRLVLTDIDGVWTDGGLYYAQDALPAKKFHTYDSFGVLALQMNDIEVGILSGDDNPVMHTRATRLKIGLVRTGVRNKLAVADELRLERRLMWSEIAYIGDDVMDLNLLKAVGLSGTVPNAPQYIQKEVGFVTPVRGGEGAFRAFAEHLLDAFDLLEDTIARIRENS
ncbi:MAG: acylneuraminate cytidylyltransferase [Bacteroidetes Order II. Incertae sedis bacterium]|nr:acylneuraminate cytidylyltransferase [Bacteroidetes Order II. bacterium]